MTADDKDVLNAERAVNEQYQRRLEELIASGAKIGVAVVSQRNQQWLQYTSKPVPSRSIIEPIAGRVELEHEDELLGTDFYIGSWHREWDGLQVVSWAAPVASLFYQGPASPDVLAKDVIARRTFRRRGDDIVAYEDELEGSHERRPFAASESTQTLQVPSAPTISRPPASGLPERGPEVVDAVAIGVTIEDDQDDVDWSVPIPSDERPPLRAEQTVFAAVSRPRTGRLTSLLATLQPEQYRLVTWPNDEPLVVQGQPGTGKTVIALHRAAYLTHTDRDNPLGRVLVIGPTTQFVEHVRGVLEALETTGVDVVSLPSMLQGAAMLNTSPQPNLEQRVDGAWQLGRLAQQAVAILKRKPPFRTQSTSKQMRHVVDALLENAPDLQHLLNGEPELREWLTELRRWDTATKSDRYLPFLASIGLALKPLRTEDRYDHIIVDEAQDIRPLEWRLIQLYLKDGAAMSLVGDLNQRRSDWSPDSWESLAEDLELTNDDGSFDPQVIDIGFRSTQAILKFANQLLPKGSRSSRALHAGTPPNVVKSTSSALDEDVAREAEALAKKHPAGLCAVIAIHPGDFEREIRRRHWVRHPTFTKGWKFDEKTILLLQPGDARGLEFDGVVVVEPADFPENVGRKGPLYTSLTRATKDLSVVHTRALPGDLRPPKKRL